MATNILILDCLFEINVIAFWLFLCYYHRKIHWWR